MSDRGGGPAAALALVAAFAAAGFAIVAMKLGLGFAVPVGIVAFVSAAGVLRGPLGQALARQIEGTRADVGAVEEATAPILAQLEEIRGRMAELEERVDFAERLLAQRREAGRLEG